MKKGKENKAIRITALSIAVIMAAPFPVYAGQEVTAKADITMEEIVNANTGEKLLESYGSYLVKKNGEEMSYYADKELRYFDYGDFQCAYMEDDNAYVHAEESDAYMAVLYTHSPDLSIFDNPVFDPEYTKRENILETKIENDKLILKTEAPSDDVQSEIESDGYEYSEGDSFVFQYMLDKDNYAFSSSVTTLCHADGSSEDYSSLSAHLDAKRPEIAQELYDRFTSSDTHTVTIILNPGTEEEASFSIDAVKGDLVSYSLPDGYSHIYTDEECTEVVSERIDTTNDVTFYSVPD